jgi:hypothetical protein
MIQKHTEKDRTTLGLSINSVGGGGARNSVVWFKTARRAQGSYWFKAISFMRNMELHKTRVLIHDTE